MDMPDNILNTSQNSGTHEENTDGQKPGEIIPN